MHFIKWVLLVIVRPAVMLAIIVNGIPPTLRAFASAVKTIVSAFR